jgi:hypothetical protein
VVRQPPDFERHARRSYNHVEPDLGRVSPGEEKDVRPLTDATALPPAELVEGGSRRALLVLLVALGLCHVGLNFEAWGWPAIDGYPTIERFLDPGFLSGDFYTDTSQGYGVDTAQAFLFGGIERITGVRYDVQLALLNFVRCLTFPALVYAFFHALSGKRDIAVVGAVLGVVSNFALPKTLGWAWVWGDPSTAMFAIPAIVAGWTLLLRRRPGACFGCFAFAAALHPLASLHGAIVVGLILLADYTPEERRAALRSPTALSGAACFGLVFVAQFLALRADPKDELPIAEYVNIMAWERHPGDYLPSRFPLWTVLAFASGVVAAVVILIGQWNQIPRIRLVVVTLGTYAMICVSGWLFVEVHPVRFFVQLIPFRTANVGAPFMLYLYACFAASLFRERQVASFACALLAALLASPYVVRAAGPYGVLLRAIAPIILVQSFFGGTRNIFRRLVVSLDAGVLRLVPGPRFSFLLAAGLVLLGIAGARARRDAFVIPRVENQHPLYGWLRAHTAPAATVFVDQYSQDGRYTAAINPQKVRLVGHRAVVASLDFPFLDRDMRGWMERWQLALHGREEDRVNGADLATLDALRERFPFELVVRNAPLPPDPRIRLEVEFHGVLGVKDVFVYRLGT